MRRIKAGDRVGVCWLEPQGNKALGIWAEYVGRKKQSENCRGKESEKILPERDKGVALGCTYRSGSSQYGMGQREISWRIFAGVGGGRRTKGVYIQLFTGRLGGGPHFG